MKWLLFATLCVASSAAFAADPQDKEGSKDPALFTRMPGFYIYNYEAKEFDRYEFRLGQDKTQAVEGKYFYVDYYAKEGIKQPSGLQIVRNYTNAAKTVGGETLYQWDDGGVLRATIRLRGESTETWACIEGAGNGMYKLFLVEKQLMAQEVTAKADALAGALRELGRVTVQGILFDTDKAELKPASEPVLAEVAKLLKAEAALKVYVVGHTDNVGTFDYNVKLSRERAAAVVAALTQKHGVAAARLLAFGAGPTSPLAANTTDAGRSRNRRVELVAQ